MRERSRPPTATTLTGLMNSIASRHPDASVAFGDVQRRAADLPDRIATLTGSLRDLGVTAGDNVAIWMPNRLEWVDTWFAVAALGATLVPLNTRFAAA